ncbi:MAG TPA: SRPBCC family protein [Candidatus Methylomirabilis sp.]|nr:SRPBCC family protein [Candidatus Methylomirabilis sp.]
MSTPSAKPDIHYQIESAQTLASRFYTDPTILDREKSGIFRRTWQLVGTLSQQCGAHRTISDPETFFIADVVGEPVVIVRDKQGTLRAFSNVCRHRAGPIAQGCGSKNVLRCAYHGWTYTLDGRLIGTPDIDGVEFFDRSTMGMVPLRCETWEQFIFVNFDQTAEPLSAFLGRIPEEASGFPFASLEFVERRDYLIDCNWKVYVDNYLEGHHIPIAHPGLMREIDYTQYRIETFRYFSQQFAPLRATRAADELEEKGADRVYATGAGTLKEALYFWVFPNLMLNIYPDNISTNLIVPLSHDKTLTIFEWFFHRRSDARDGHSERTEESGRPDRPQERVTQRSPLPPALSDRIHRAVAFSDEVQQEDIALCQAVQRGLQSSTYDRGRYSPKRENGVHHFHRLLSEFLARP